MAKFITAVKKFVTKEEEGASMAEYALLLTLITVALVGLITALSGQIGTVIGNATAALAT
jgi:Flp pilus assembly pilin Flp